MNANANFQTAASLLGGWRDEIMNGTPPVLFPVGDGVLGQIEIGPGLVTLVGGVEGREELPTMQMVGEALIRTPTLRALVANVEMSPTALLDRQIARLADIDLTLIRHRRLGVEHRAAVTRGFDVLTRIGDRLAFLRPPFDLENIALSADAFGPDVIVLDYVQRFGVGGKQEDQRISVGAMMGALRHVADNGTSVIAVSAMSRSRDNKGRSSYSGETLGLASFRESSELEDGADDAFLLVAAGDSKPDDQVVLRHLKNRFGEARDITLVFNKLRQRFTSVEPSAPPCRFPSASSIAPCKTSGTAHHLPRGRKGMTREPVQRQAHGHGRPRKRRGGGRTCASRP